MRNINKIIFVLAAFTTYQAAAQKPVPDQSQDVIKNFDAKLLESEKVKVNPVLPPVDTATKAQSYNVPNKVLNVDYQPPRLRPISMPSQKLPPQYDGYAKLGYGFPNSPYAEAAYRFGDPKEYLVGLKAKYHAATDKKVENQMFSKLDAEANGTFFVPAGIAVDAKVGFQNDVNHYYGYNFSGRKDTSFTSDATKQAFSNFGVSARAYNSVRTVADFNYGLGVSFNVLSDFYSSKETEIGVKLNATKWFAEKHPLTIILRTEFTNFDARSSTLNQTLNNIYLQPSFTFKGDMFSIKLGANLISSADIFYPKPDVEATLNLAGNKLGIFAGWRGDFNKNNFRNLSKYNPFIASVQTIKNTEVDEYYGGLKGGLSGFEYSFQGGYSKNGNLALYLLDTSDVKGTFKVLYDTINIFNLRGAITYHPTSNLEITGTVSQNVYTALKQKAAWGLPSLDVNMGAKYTIINDPKTNQMASVRASLFVQNGVNYKLKNGDADRLNTLYDLSLGGEYFFSKNIGLFLDINNILDNKRQRWQNLPTFGLNVLGGISARF